MGAKSDGDGFLGSGTLVDCFLIKNNTKADEKFALHLLSQSTEDYEQCPQ